MCIQLWFAKQIYGAHSARQGRYDANQIYRIYASIYIYIYIQLCYARQLYISHLLKVPAPRLGG